MRLNELWKQEWDGNSRDFTDEPAQRIRFPSTLMNIMWLINPKSVARSMLQHRTMAKNAEQQTVNGS
jgi:hypothetical protein